MTTPNTPTNQDGRKAKQRESDLKRFFAKINKTETCWVWMGSTWRRYESFWFEGKLRKAHRASWVMTNGPIPKDMHVLHKCDNPPCVNPDHLFLGTQKDNSRDMVQKGRSKGYVHIIREKHRDKQIASLPRGEDHPQAKLTWADVEKIKILNRQGMFYKDIAKKMNVCKCTIYNVMSGRNWKPEIVEK